VRPWQAVGPARRQGQAVCRCCLDVEGGATEDGGWGWWVGAVGWGMLVGGRRWTGREALAGGETSHAPGIGGVPAIGRERRERRGGGGEGLSGGGCWVGDGGAQAESEVAVIGAEEGRCAVARVVGAEGRCAVAGKEVMESGVGLEGGVLWC